MEKRQTAVNNSTANEAGDIQPVRQVVSPRGRKILVVDDERHIVRLMQVNLEHAGFTVLKAYDGIEALEQIRTEQPDLVFLDAMMPHLDGFETLRAIRAEARTRALPVVMLTARAQDADIARACLDGADFYLTKPFNPVEIWTMARRILDKGYVAERNKICV